MKKTIIWVLLMMMLVACEKHEEPLNVYYDDVFEVSFMLEGKSYHKAYPKHQIQPMTGTGVQLVDGTETMARGPLYEGDGWDLIILLGYTRFDGADTLEHLQRLQDLVTPGVKPYKCLYCLDTTITNSVEVQFNPENSGLQPWTITKNGTSQGPAQITDEQDGSRFEITSITPSSTNGANRNAFIIKGTFDCNLYHPVTRERSRLTDGKFTFLLNAFEN